MIPALQESVRFSKLPSPCVELVWATGDRILALPAGFLSSANWDVEDDRERVTCDWGGWVIVLGGHGLQRLPAALVRAEISAITELPADQAAVTQGAIVTTIVATEKRTEETR